MGSCQLFSKERVVYLGENALDWKVPGILQCFLVTFVFWVALPRLRGVTQTKQAARACAQWNQTI